MSLRLRLLLGALLAATALFALSRMGGEQQSPPAQAPAEDALATAEAVQRARVLAALAGRAERILLALQLDAMPAEAAPVLGVQQGFLQLLRPPPPPAGPQAPSWPSAGICVPAPLPALEPRDRAALLDACAALAGLQSPLDRVEAVDFELDPAELARLRRWQR